MAGFTQFSTQISNRLGPALYRLGQRWIGALPANLLRIRPCGIHEIRLLADGGENFEIDPKYRVSWVETDEEKARVATLATAENISQLGPDTHRAAAIWEGEELLGVAWIATVQYVEPELKTRYLLAEDEAWLFAAVVDPSSRRRGVYRQLLQVIVQDLAKLGFRRLLFGVSAGNIASRMAHRSAGATQIGAILAARSCGVTFCKSAGQAIRRGSLSTTTGTADVHFCQA